MIREVLTKLLHFYDKKYKQLLIIPFLILFLAISSIAFKYATTGEFINKGISLKGGTTITIPSLIGIDSLELESGLLEKFPGSEMDVRILTSKGESKGFVIDTDLQDIEDVDRLRSTLENDYKAKDMSVESMGSSLGGSFFKETFRAMIIAFVFMSIVVFIYFRVPIPCVAVILAAASDIIVTLAIVNILGIKLSTAGIAAFLMLIGYSVDTDILLSTRVLKRKEGTIMERVIGAMKTGLMMNFTTMAAIITALTLAKSDVLIQIMTILLIGLFIDLINTWIQNVGLLRLYLERKHKNE